MTIKYLAIFIVLIMFSGLALAGTLSVSEITYDENSDEILAEFIVDGTNETLNTTISAEELSNISPGNTDKNLEISAELLDTKAEYSVEDRNLVQIMHLELVEEEFNNKADRDRWADNNCLTEGIGEPHKYEGRSLGWTGYSPTYKYYVGCAILDSSQPVYNVGFLQSPPDSTFKVKWTVKTDGEDLESKILSNTGVSEGQQTSLGDHVTIQWISLRDLGRDAPNPQNTLAGFSSSGDNWRLINRGDYQSYKFGLERDVPNLIEKAGSKNNAQNRENILQEFEESLTNSYLRARQNYTSSKISGAQEPNSVSINDGVWKLDSSSDIEWFVSDFAVRIDGAEYLEIGRDSGTPSIISAENVEVGGLGAEIGEVKVENIGDSAGVFELQVACSTGFSHVGVSNQASLAPGEVHTFYPVIGADGGEELGGSCNATIEDRESLETDYIEFNANFNPEKECNAGSQFVEVENGQEVIYECSEDNVSVSTVDVCGADEEAVAEGRGYECKELDGRLITSREPEECRIYILPKFIDDWTETSYNIADPICMLEKWEERIKTGFELISNILYIGAVIVGGLIGVFIGRKYIRELERTKILKNRLAKILAILAVLAISLALSYSVIM